MSNKDIRRIGPFPNNRRGFIRFVDGLLEAGADGYHMPTKDFNPEAKIQKGARLQIFLHKDGEAVVEAPVEPVVEPEKSIEDKIKGDDSVGKAELVAFAKANNIEIPDKAKQPNAIRKVIKESLLKDNTSS